MKETGNCIDVDLCSLDIVAFACLGLIVTHPAFVLPLPILACVLFAQLPEHILAISSLILLTQILEGRADSGLLGRNDAINVFVDIGPKIDYRAMTNVQSPGIHIPRTEASFARTKAKLISYLETIRSHHDVHDIQL